MTQDLLPRPMLLEEFTPFVGKLMRVDCAPRNLDITLIEASPLKEQGTTLRPPFILIFHSDATALLSPGIYTLRSGNFGPDLVYLESVTAPYNAAPGNYYQAVFN
ncbi:DUF6916 family protein [Sphingomonas koreensis]